MTGRPRSDTFKGHILGLCLLSYSHHCWSVYSDLNRDPLVGSQTCCQLTPQTHYLEPHQRIELCFLAYNTSYIPDENGILVVLIGFEPMAFRVSDECSHQTELQDSIGGKQWTRTTPAVRRTRFSRPVEAPCPCITFLMLADPPRFELGTC